MMFSSTNATDYRKPSLQNSWAELRNGSSNDNESNDNHNDNRASGCGTIVTPVGGGTDGKTQSPPERLPYPDIRTIWGKLVQNMDNNKWCAFISPI